MRAPAGKLRWLAIVIAVAIAWPSNSSLDHDQVGGSRVAHAHQTGAASPGDCPNVHRLKANLAWQSPDGRLNIDQSEESDEGDDGRHLGVVPGLLPPHGLPSLIPARVNQHEPAPAHKSLPLGALGRLRC